MTINNPNLTIYFDLDETLISTDVQTFTTHIKTGERYLNLAYNAMVNYEVTLREGAVDILNYAKKLGDIKILTVADEEYAHDIISHFKFPVEKSDVYCRQDIYLNRGVCQLNNPGDRILLIDNLPIKDNQDKVKFLGGNVDYYNIEPYYGFDDKPEKEVFPKLKKWLMKQNKR